MDYKFILIEREAADVHQRPAYTVRNKQSLDALGEISYYPRWRQFIFAPVLATIFSSGCLNDLIHFLKNHAGKDSATARENLM
jgi:hypothetical protein